MVSQQPLPHHSLGGGPPLSGLQGWIQRVQASSKKWSVYLDGMKAWLFHGWATPE